VARLDPGADASVTLHAAQQASTRFLEHFELGLGVIDTEVVERFVLGFFDRLGRDFDPLHSC